MKTQEGSKNALITATFMVLLLVGVFVFIRYTMNRTQEEPEVLISQEQITITGQYGRSYPLSSITSITLVEGTPQLGRKINGAGLSRQKTYRGHYEVAGFGQCRVFLMGDEGPYIMLYTEDETVLIMYRDNNKTIDTYERLVGEIP